MITGTVLSFHNIRFGLATNSSSSHSMITIGDARHAPRGVQQPRAVDYLEFSRVGKVAALLGARFNYNAIASLWGSQFREICPDNVDPAEWNRHEDLFIQAGSAQWELPLLDLTTFNALMDHLAPIKDKLAQAKAAANWLMQLQHPIMLPSTALLIHEDEEGVTSDDCWENVGINPMASI